MCKELTTRNVCLRPYKHSAGLCSFRYLLSQNTWSCLMTLLFSLTYAPFLMHSVPIDNCAFCYLTLVFNIQYIVLLQDLAHFPMEQFALGNSALLEDSAPFTDSPLMKHSALLEDLVLYTIQLFCPKIRFIVWRTVLFPVSSLWISNVFVAENVHFFFIASDKSSNRCTYHFTTIHNKNCSKPFCHHS